MRTLLWGLLSKLLDAAEFGLVSSNEPRGRRLGGHDVPEVRDKYLVLSIGFRGLVSFVGYWQTA